MRTAGPRGRGAVAVAGAVVALTACGSGQDAPSDFCKAVDSLDAAVTQINQTSLSKSTVEAVQASLGTIEKAVRNLAATAEAESADEVDAVKATAQRLGRAVSAAVDEPTPADVSVARASMENLTGAVENLAQSTSSSC